MAGRGRAPRSPLDLGPLPPGAAEALSAKNGGGAPPPAVTGSEQVFLVVDGIDVRSTRAPNGEEMRTMVIPTMGGLRVYLVPLQAAYAHELARRLQAGDDVVIP